MQACVCSSVRGVRSRVVTLISAVSRGCELSTWCRLSRSHAEESELRERDERVQETHVGLALMDTSVV